MYYVYTGMVEYIHTYHATLCNGIMVVWVLAIYIVWYTLHTNITISYVERVCAAVHPIRAMLS